MKNKYIFDSINDLEIFIENTKKEQVISFIKGNITSNWNNKEIIFNNSEFLNENELDKHILEKNIFGKLNVYKVSDFIKFEDMNLRVKFLIENIELIKNEIEDINFKLIDRVKDQKSLTKSCICCGSIIKKEFIKSTFCPVCNDKNFLFTETDLKILENKNLKIKKYEEELNCFYDKYKNKGLKYLKNFENFKYFLIIGE